MTHEIPSGSGFGTTRIEALADGIFAVAMTLLVLDVKLPNGEFHATSGALLDRLFVARSIVLRTTLFATVPALSIIAVFYNTRLALYLYFLRLVVHFLPGRVDMTDTQDDAGNR